MAIKRPSRRPARGTSRVKKTGPKRKLTARQEQAKAQAELDKNGALARKRFKDVEDYKDKINPMGKNMFKGTPAQEKRLAFLTKKWRTATAKAKRANHDLVNARARLQRESGH